MVQAVPEELSRRKKPSTGLAEHPIQVQVDGRNLGWIFPPKIEQDESKGGKKKDFQLSDDVGGIVRMVAERFVGQQVIKPLGIAS